MNACSQQDCLHVAVDAFDFFVMKFYQLIRFENVSVYAGSLREPFDVVCPDVEIFQNAVISKSAD